MWPKNLALREAVLPLPAGTTCSSARVNNEETACRRRRRSILTTRMR
jgi:hypothetical protein